MSQTRFVACCRCHKKLKVSKYGYAKRCVCRPEIGVMEAVDKLSLFLKEPKILQGGSFGGDGTKKNKQATQTITGLKGWTIKK